MHEVGIAASVLEAVKARAQGRTVVAFGLRVGSQLAVVQESLQQGFEVVAMGSEAATAAVQMESVDGDELTLTWLEYDQ